MQQQNFKSQISIMRNIASFILFIFLLVPFSCSDNLEDLNINPNQPEAVSAGVLLTSAMRSAMNASVTEGFLIGNNAAQLTAKTLRTEVDIYSWNAFPTVWDAFYTSIANLSEAERTAAAAGNANMEGIAKVMKAWSFSVLTAAYGDVPYSEAIEGVTSGNYTPVYDSQQDILTGAGGVLDELAAAYSLLGTGGAVSGDIIYNGDVAKWKKLANALRLRLLMHASNKTDVSAAFNQIVNTNDLMASNEDGAALAYLASFPNEFPLIPLKTGDFDAVAMSDRSIGVMKQYNDPRLMAFARPDNLDFNAPTFDGAVNGSENTDACEKSGSRLGLAYFDYPGHPVQSDHAEGLLMTFSEQQFILAEAAFKGLINGDPEAYYKSGIEASMEYYNVNYEVFGYVDFEDYYNNSGVAYDASLNQIREQKWLALFFTGLEPYFEVRRWLYESDFDWDAIPFLYPTCENVNSDQLPLRFPYPGEEKSLNKTNYDAAASRIGGDTQNSPVWLVQ